MTEQEAENLLKRIICHPGIFGGKPSIRGRRLAVEHVLSDLAAGETPASILDNFPFLEMDDVRACLVYAARNVRRGANTDPTTAPGASSR